ncbi:MAG: hypothetical protein ACKER6_00120 [Candidatus Hodgkinia cicadicola]
MYDAIVDMCDFPTPIAALLKSCFGQPSALNATLAIIRRNLHCTYPPLDWSAFRHRLSYFFKMISSEIAPFKVHASVRRLIMTEAASKMCNVSLQSLNMFRRLVSMSFEVDAGLRMFYDLPLSQPLWRLIKRVSDNLRPLTNVKVVISHLTPITFDSKASAVHQFNSPLASISGLSYGKGAFGSADASAFSTFAYAP